MAKLTIVFGILFIVLGLIGFITTGSAHPTALIPSVFGIAFIFFGIMANSPDVKKRMTWMHIAVTVALLGFIGTIPADIQVVQLTRHVFFPHPAAIQEKGAMSLLCLIYVILCVRSFINARRSRTA